VAGQLADREVMVRTRGGAVGKIGQIVEGEALLPVGSASLLFLRLAVDPVSKAPLGYFTVVARAQGQFPIVVGDDHERRLVRASDVGGLVPPATAATQPAQRLAGEALHQRRVDDAVRDIVALWPRLHPRQGSP
jgi:hypothetical protein